MEEISRRVIYNYSTKKIQKKSKKKSSPASSLRKLAGGWTKKEADEFLMSLEPFDHISKVPHK